MKYVFFILLMSDCLHAMIQIDKLCWAIDKGKIKMAEELIPWIDINQKSFKQATPLMHASVGDRGTITARKEIMLKLLAAGAQVNLKVAGMTALHLSIFQECEDFTSILLYNGADVNAQDADGDTPLHYALFFRFEDKKKFETLLLSHGARRDIPNNAGYCADDQWYRRFHN